MVGSPSNWSLLCGILTEVTWLWNNTIQSLFVINIYKTLTSVPSHRRGGGMAKNSWGGRGGLPLKNLIYVIHLVTSTYLFFLFNLDLSCTYLYLPSAVILFSLSTNFHCSKIPLRHLSRLQTRVWKHNIMLAQVTFE